MSSRGRIAELLRGVGLLWLNTCLLFVALNVAAYLVLATTSSPDASPRPAAHVDAALRRLFPDLSEDDLREVVRENTHEYTYEPFTQFREKPVAGKYFNVDPAGFRRSRNQGPWPPEARFFNVFVFGGSTTFGIGVPDDQTIASHLQAAFPRADDQREVRVYNFGRGAYYSSQERALFDRLVVAGTTPDLAIFIDGLNDFFFVDARDRPALTEGLEKLVDRREEGGPSPVAAAVNQLPVMKLLARWGLVARPRPVMLSGPQVATENLPAFDDPAVSDWVIRRYVTNKRLIEGAAGAIRVPTVFVWQPVPTYKYDLQYHTFKGTFGRTEYARFGYPRMAEYTQTHPLGPNFVWCADLQENLHELLYVDQVHYAPSMSQRIAQCIADAIRERRLAGAR